MLQQDVPEDYVIATGVTTTIRDFVIMAFLEVGIELAFENEGINEIAVVKNCNNPDYQIPIGTKVVAVDKAYFRPTEVELLIGDPSKAKQNLMWEPKYDLMQLCREMMLADLKLFKNS
jgi:GDPmannose 4,6-dehydratase